MKVKKGGVIGWKGKVYTAGQELPEDYQKGEVEPQKTNKPKTSKKDR